ncbi:MAG: hypothetical protein WCC12_12325 [Anaerolineales bacterium]
MERNFNLPIEPKPAASQSIQQYHLTLASFGLAFTLTTIQPTQPNVPLYDKINIPLQRSVARSVIGINAYHVSQPSKTKQSWLSALAKRIRDKIPDEEWAAMPMRPAADIDDVINNA